MKLYHYTTLDTLALILKTKSIKFNRLDLLDDNEEFVVSNGIKFGQYFFVSCWTNDSNESIPLWNMYAKNHNGIRICLEADMFEDYFIPSMKLPNGETLEANILCKIPNEEYLKQDRFLMNPVFPKNENLGNSFFHAVTYVDNVAEKVKDIVNINDNQISISLDKVGKYKNKIWEFQKEVRFKLAVWPFNPCYYSSNEVVKVFSDSFAHNIPLSFDCYFLKLKNDVLDNIEITLRYNALESDRVIAESLCSIFTKNGKVFDSSLKGLVK